MSSIYCYKQSTDTRRIKKKNAIFWLDVGGHAEIFFKFAYNSTLSFSSQLSTPFRSPYKWKGKKKTCDFRPEVFKFVPGKKFSLINKLSLLCYWFFFHYLMPLALGIWDLILKAKKIQVCVVVCAFPFRNCLNFIFSLSTLTITITHKIFIHDNPSCSIYMWFGSPKQSKYVIIISCSSY